MAYRWCALAAFLLACQSKAPPPPPPPPTAGSSNGSATEPDQSISLVRFDAPAFKLPQQSSFKLVAAGTSPAVLRYASTPDAMSYLATTELTTRRTSGATWSAPTKMRPVTTGIAFTPSAQGTIIGRPLVGEAEDPASPDAAVMLNAWRPLERRRFSVTFDERGTLGAPAFQDDPQSVSAAAVTELEQRLLLTQVPVPEEPVGVGGSWRVVTLLRHGPFVVKQTAVYTLVARTDAKWTVKAEIQRIGEPQPIVDPSIPSGATVELILLLRRYNGTLELTPGHVIGSGTLAVESSLHIRITSKSAKVLEEIVEDSGTIKLRATAP